MSRRSLRVLIAHDSPNDCLLILQELRLNFEPVYKRVDTEKSMTEALEEETWDVVISDNHLRSFDGLKALNLVKKRGIDTPFILISDSIGEEKIVTAMRAGVHDYISKDNLTRLLPAVSRELQQCELRKKRRKTENSLRQSQKMETIGHLTSGVAHDFNTVLASILLYAEAILAAEPSDDSVRNYAEQIKKVSNQGAALSRQLLLFSRKQVFELQLLDLNLIVSELVEMLQRLVGENIRITTELDPTLGKITADPSQFGQILMNLVVNARDAMPTGGSLNVRTRNHLIHGSTPKIGVNPGQYVTLEVTDTGCGMNEETKSHIFEAFFTTKGPTEGTGLGLSTVYEIVEKSGGFIEISSTPTKGTTFLVYFPKADGPTATSALHKGL